MDGINYQIEINLSPLKSQLGAIGSPPTSSPCPTIREQKSILSLLKIYKVSSPIKKKKVSLTIFFKK
jgi:hypothetical protein